MRGLKRLLLLLLLLVCSAPVTISASETYIVTETQLMELETVFTELRSQQKQQERLLTEQCGQIKTLETQLAASQTQIESSKRAVSDLETRLAEANQYLGKSADSAKRTKQRLERQRNTWAILAAVTVGAAIARG